MQNGEREAVLRMVAEGSISVEQALELLDAMAPPPEPEPRRAMTASGLGQLLEEALASRLAQTLGGFSGPRPGGPPRPPAPPRPAHPRWGPMPRTVRAPRSVRPGLSFEDLVELKTQGVSKEYADSLLSVFPDADAGDLGECRRAGVTVAYARDVAAALGDTEISELIELHEHGVTVEYLAALRARFPDLDASQAIEAVESGIDLDDLSIGDDHVASERGAQEENGPAVRPHGAAPPSA